MSGIDYTGAQKKAVETRERDLLVHAGAGSGKTRVLVGRFYDLVTRDQLAPSRILTITFTEKAAQEMKDRLRKLFPPEEGREWAREINHAYISTVHAFCSRLLRENALEARVDPDFMVLEEYEAQRVQRDCLREVLNHQARAADQNFTDFLLEVASPDLEADFLKLYQQGRGKGYKQFSFSADDTAVEKYQAVVNRILSDLDRSYSDYKARQGWLDFADLELKARGLLIEHEDLRKELQNKWPHILLDELQDTNRLQLEIINLLRTPGQFFAVGDPHQSIYGFRFADLNAYRELQREVSRKGGEVLPLEENFRSRPPLLDLVDYCFRALWPAPPADFSHLKMKAASSFAKKTIPSVEAFIFTSKIKASGRSFEADAVCRRIYELVGEDALPIYDKEEKRVRPLEFGDCAILLRRTTHIKFWERALQKYGIPYQVMRSRGFFGTPEVADMLNLLKVLENPRDDLALAAYLRSSLVGVSEHTLWLLAQASQGNGRQPLFWALESKVAVDDPIEEEKLAFAGEFITHLRDLRSQGFYHLLRRGMEESRYPAKSYLQPQGERIRANLQKLLQLTQEMSRTGNEHLRDLLEVAEYLRYQKDEIAEGEVVARGKGCLSLSTIHGAKGLEFPLVAVAELDSQLQYREANLYITGENRLAVKIKDAATGKNVTLGADAGEEKQQKQAEELRLLYVALTRAQEHLLLSGTLKFNKDGSLDKRQWIQLVEDKVPFIAPLKSAAEAGQQVTTLGEVPVRLNWRALSGDEPDPLVGSVGAIHELPLHNDKEQTPEIDEKKVAEKGQALLEQVRRAESPVDGSHYMLTVSEVVDFYRCPRLYQLKYLWGLKGEEWEGGTGEWAKDDGEGGEGSSRDLGVFVHGLLAKPEWLDVGAQPPIPDALKGEESRIRDMLDNFLKSPWKQAMEKAAKVERELPLVVKLKDGLLRGQVDALIFEDKDKYVLLDYKTGRAAEEEKGYRLQLQLYALALEKIYGIEPQKAILYYLPEGISQEVSLEKKDLEAAEDWAGKLFRAQKQQEFPYKEEYCSTCRQRELCKEIK